MFKKPTFEVETRLHFATVDEAYAGIPFLKDSLTAQTNWQTTHYGQQLYHADQILRIGDIQSSTQHRLWLGWKGPDQGQFVNIRQELDEEITCGIAHSSILSRLGGEPALTSSQAVVVELERLGYPAFMSFSGFNRSGFYHPLAIHLKVMHCQILKWPLLVEIEKTATHWEDALRCQAQLNQLLDELGLTNRVVRDEPPTLLYQAQFIPEETG